MNMNDYYYTNDLGLAAAISLFYPLESIDKTNPQRAQFVFKREPQLDELIQSYWQGELKANLQAYWNQLKITKSRLYEGGSS